MSDEQLRALFEEAVSARAGRSRRECVSPDALMTLVEREGSETDRLGILDHVISCPDCHREFELLRAVRAGRDADPAVDPVRSSGPRDRSGWWMALAASLVLVIGAGVVSQVIWGGAQRTVRGSEDVVELVGFQNGPDGGRALTWHAVSGALSYRVEVLDARGELLYAAELADTVLTLPDSVSTDSSEGSVWWVQASLADGSRRSGGPEPVTPSGR
jgi:hypothetical protein